MPTRYAERDSGGATGIRSRSERFVVTEIEIATLLKHLLETHSGYAGNYKIKNFDDAPVNIWYLRGLHDGVHRTVGTSQNEHPYVDKY